MKAKTADIIGLPGVSKDIKAAHVLECVAATKPAHVVVITWQDGKCEPTLFSTTGNVPVMHYYLSRALKTLIEQNTVSLPGE